jgi:hypothetical protein
MPRNPPMQGGILIEPRDPPPTASPLGKPFVRAVPHYGNHGKRGTRRPSQLSTAPLPFQDRLRDHGADRPPEIAATVDRPRCIEPDRLVRRVDHRLRWYGQGLQRRDRETPIAYPIRCQRLALSLGERERNAIHHGGWRSRSVSRHRSRRGRPFVIRLDRLVDRARGYFVRELGHGRHIRRQLVAPSSSPASASSSVRAALSLSAFSP